MHKHGGDVYGNSIKYDFSTNVNPFGMPLLVKNELKKGIDSVGIYPQYRPEGLRVKLGECLDINPDEIVLTAGASEAFLAVARALMLKKATIFEPCFYGYEYALNASFTSINRMELEDLLEGEYNVSDDNTQAIWIANPNNPTGDFIHKENLIPLVKRALSLGIYVIVDECFIELTDFADESLIHEYYPNLIIIRSFTKSFAIPGIRLGYAVIKDAELREQVQNQLPEWNLSSQAIIAGTAALDCMEELEDARDLIYKERNHITKKLIEKGYKIHRSSTNFILFKGPIDLKDKLLEKGILIRDCSNFNGLGPGTYRIAVKLPEENDELLYAMENVDE